MKRIPAFKNGKIKMKTRKFFRDGIEELITGAIKISITSDGHVIESYKTSDGKRRYFATLAGTHWCAHGSSVASAVADAIWKDPIRRHSLEAVKVEIKNAGKKRKITLNEFRILTGACLTGCREALQKAGRDETPLTAFEIRDHVSRDWGNKLLSVLEWDIS
jgi:hypothetical protein